MPGRPRCASSCARVVPTVGAGLSIERLDTDGDGRISRNEFLDGRLERVADMFERQDRDGDGLISIEDRGPRGRGEGDDRGNRPGRPGMDREALVACVQQSVAGFDPEDDEGRGPVPADADTDGDGFLSLSELSMALEARAIAAFDANDTNGDGYIDSDEIAARRAQMDAARDATRDCMRAQRNAN